MFALYDCPDCHRIHDEPAEPAYVLSVRCFDCALELTQHEERKSDHTLAPAA